MAVTAEAAEAACVLLSRTTHGFTAATTTRYFRLIALGTDGLVKAGYSRVKHEVVTGPMPPFGSIIKTSDDLWRIIAFMRSVNPSSSSLLQHQQRRNSRGDLCGVSSPYAMIA